MKDFIELRRIVAILTSRIWLLIFLTSSAALIGLLVSRDQTPVYGATTTMLVGEFMQSASVNRADIQTSADVAKTYADMALRQPVLNQVVEKLKLDETWQDLKKQVRVSVREGTQLIEITAEAGSPAAARTIADEVAGQLIAISPTTLEGVQSDLDYAFIRDQITSLKQRLTDAQNRISQIDSAIAASTSKTEISQLEQERSALEQSITEWEKNYVSLSDLARQERSSNNYLTIIEPAQGSRDPVRPRILLDTIIAGAVGLLLALGIVFLGDYLDNTVHSAEQYEELLGLAPLAVIGTVIRPRWPRFTDRRKSERRQRPLPGSAAASSDTGRVRLITVDEPTSIESESFRTLRTNVQFASLAKPLRSLVVTSAVPREGKTFVAANLAVAMAQNGRRVVLVDADLRRPSLHTVFGLPNNSGLTSLILTGDVPASVQQIADVPNLLIITSGPLPANPSELLNSNRVARVMSYLSERTDFVIYDSPPAGMVTDAAIMGTSVDGVILVARARATRRDLILKAKQALETVGVSVILPVLNAVVPRDMSMYQGYYRHYRAGHDGPRGAAHGGHKDQSGSDDPSDPVVEEPLSASEEVIDEHEETARGIAQQA